MTSRRPVVLLSALFVAAASFVAGAADPRRAAAADEATAPSPPPPPASRPAVRSGPDTRPLFVRRAPATRPTTRGTTRPAGVAAATSRPAARPTLTPEEYKAEADRLRAAYLKPPAEWPRPDVDPGVEYVELGVLTRPTFPEDNAYSEAKAELGKMLFFDPRLSGSGQIACATCHEPELGWSDGKTVSHGHARSPLRRNAPSLINAAHRKALFWDGRAASLEAQALEPIAASDEMNADPVKMVAALAEQAEYRKRFASAFGDANPEGAGPNAVTLDRVAKAIATFERTVVSRPSKFDQFLLGIGDALSDEAVRGLHLFRTQARCVNCHMGPTLTDEKFHDVGLSYYGRSLEDLGRYHVTNDPADVGKFKTPSLRNLPRTAPYMHNGLFDLPGVLNLYNAGMPTIRRKVGQENDPLFPTKSPLLKPLRLNARDLADLKSFLESLEELRLRIRPPALPGIDPPASSRPRRPGAATRPASEAEEP